MTIPVAAGRVLPTLNEDGSRRWLCPKPSYGAYWHRRRTVAWILIALFVAIPHVRIGGRPAMLLDLPRREFTLFGATFLPTDTLLLMLLLLSIVIAVFMLTALFGRVWCGWGCPQTVWMEFVFRPLERWIEGGRAALIQRTDRGEHLHPRRPLKHAAFLVVALVLAHTFLAYFVGVERLAVWVRRSPIEHPTSFLIMAGTTALVLLDFAWFREQTCMVACPYGRWQSVLLDRQSLIVAYDAARGEPRARGTKARPADAGDCIDCNACVATCPTGIDIRDGLQMECIHCTQCADACDAVMRKIGRPTGLIRYSSQDALAGRAPHWLRPRVVLYPAALALFLGAFAWQLAARRPADLTLLRAIGAPFTVEPDGRVANQLRVKIANRADGDRAYAIAILGVPAATVVAPENPLRVARGQMATTSLFVLLPASEFTGGQHAVTVRIDDGHGYVETREWRLAGPDAGGARPSDDPSPPEAPDAAHDRS